MRCNLCGKNSATIHYSQVINGKSSELHICEDCAEKKGLHLTKPFSVSDFLAGITDISIPKSEKKSIAKNKCSVCGFTLDNFKEMGRLGCSNCYNTFQKSLVNILKRVHGSEAHVGKTPGAEFNEVLDLKKQLERAVEKEEYEKAADLRDKIKALDEIGKKTED